MPIILRYIFLRHVILKLYEEIIELKPQNSWASSPKIITVKIPGDDLAMQQRPQRRLNSFQLHPFWGFPKRGPQIDPQHILIHL